MSYTVLWQKAVETTGPIKVSLYCFNTALIAYFFLPDLLFVPSVFATNKHQAAPEAGVSALESLSSY